MSTVITQSSTLSRRRRTGESGGSTGGFPRTTRPKRKAQGACRTTGERFWHSTFRV
jgi:hypothetical protein